MTDRVSDEAFRIFSDLWEASMNAGQHLEAVRAGVSTFLIANGRDERIANGALNLMLVAISAHYGLKPPELSGGPAENPESGCSFCGRKQSEVRLAAGPSAHICEECVRQLGDVFVNDPGGKAKGD